MVVPPVTKEKVSMDLEFGKSVLQKALELEKSGKDPNQIANILWSQDKKGHNYGIGVVLNGKGQALPSSSTLLKLTADELKNSQDGNYKNSTKDLQKLKEAVLNWQRIPKKYWDNFVLTLPSDAGTGAVQTAVLVALANDSKVNSIAVEELGWPAYKAITKLARVDFQEFPSSQVKAGNNCLTIYQSGPLNTTGEVQTQEIISERAQASQKTGSPVLLDRAYSGFEFASQIKKSSYDDVMQKSYVRQIAPFIEAGTSFFLALSPTKAFGTFSLRPCGLLLYHSPEKKNLDSVSLLLNSAIRARGSSFEHPVTRAFAKALLTNISGLEKEHAAILKRLATAQTLWAQLVKGTGLEDLFSDNFAGLFRNAKAKKEAGTTIYGNHLYPVLAGDRCRLNISGIPDDELIAKKQVEVFTHCLTGG